MKYVIPKYRKKIANYVKPDCLDISESVNEGATAFIYYDG